MKTDLKIIKELPRERYPEGHSKAGVMKKARGLMTCKKGHKAEMDIVHMVNGCRHCRKDRRARPPRMPRVQPNAFLRAMDSVKAPLSGASQCPATSA